MTWSGGTYRKWNYSSNGWAGDAALGVGIEAGRHDQQDDDFTDGINACLTKNGSNAATGNLNLGAFKITNMANGSSASDAATFGQLSSVVPTGTIAMYGAAAAPSGYLLCDGTAVSRTLYSTLFSTIGTTYGVGDGSTTFNIPNLKQRFPLGKADTGTGSTLGGTGGAIDHTHTSAAHTHTVASHTHTINSHTHTLSNAGAAKITGGGSPSDTIMERVSTATWTANLTTSPDVPWAAPGTAPTSSQGAGLTGSTDASGTLTSNGTALTTDSTTPGATGANNPPYLVVNFIIKT